MPRGGKRKGAGRKPVANKKKRYSTRLRPDQIKWLKNKNASKTIENALDRIMADEYHKMGCVGSHIEQ